MSLFGPYSITLHVFTEFKGLQASPLHRFGNFLRGDLNLMDVSNIFFRGARRGGGRFFIENPRRGVSRRERGRGAGRVSAANWGFGGGKAKIFFRG